ncbi:MAG TPA: Gfo/Idh/MocA family oxidoreductase [Gemmataceae bacterium]|nr:Gfo/Idh/MocA family oxidoreductase [Gemmataceae bacterium]
MPARKMTRRTFHTAAAGALGLTAVSYQRVLGANERVKLGFIGVSNRGGQLLDAFTKLNDIQVTALCDVWKPSLEKASARFDGKAATHGDFRKLIDSKDVDAVVIATPDHWHAIMTITACKADKDVYCEKPLSITIREGRRMVEVARETKRVVQVGTHRRSSRLYAKLANEMQGGKIGKVTVSRCYRLSDMYPDGIGKAEPTDSPKNLNWDMWLGPRPERKFQATIHPYKFRWHELYSSQMGNWGVHYLDAIRWLTGEEAPSAVVAVGGRYAIDDDRTIPDTMEAVFEFASGRMAIFGQYEASQLPALTKGEVELRGTLGALYISEREYEVMPEKLGQFQTPKSPRAKAEKGTADDGDLTVQHARNFIDCVKSREKPNADVEIGHRSTTMSLLANIALKTKMRLEWDAKKEMVTNCPQANELLHYEYRKPWKLG